MDIGSVNRLNQGDVLFREGEKVQAVYMVLKGKVEIFNRGLSAVAGAGTLLGSNDAGNGLHSCSCVVKEPAAVYAFAADGAKSLQTILASNKEYGGLAIYSHSRIIQEMAGCYRRIYPLTKDIYTKLKSYYDAYIKLIRENGLRARLMPEIVQQKEFQPEIEVDNEKLSVYLEYNKIPYEAVKEFFLPSQTIAVSVFKEILCVEESLQDICAEASDYLLQALELLIGSEENCLYQSLLELGTEMRIQGRNIDTVKSMAEDCMSIMNAVKTVVKHSGRTWDINEDRIEKITELFNKGIDFRGEQDLSTIKVDSDVVAEIGTLQNSLQQIIDFAGLSDDDAKAFTAVVDEFIKMPDRDSTDDIYRKLRRDIAEGFYELYSKVFCNAVNKSELPKAVDLFLEYGYVSEKLLKEEQLIELLSIRRVKHNEPCFVYTIREWLTAVLKGEKEPSRNDMGQDYAEVLRDLKKQGKIDAEKEKELLSNGAMKLDYEIRNVFSRANRIVNGQLSTFVPILHSGMFIGGVEKGYLSARRINDTIQDLLDIDFSVFHREALYTNEKLGIEREYEMKKVYPVIITFPTVGQNAVMWQEITGRKRDSEARFMLPIFSYNSLRDMLIKVFGQFRWALCKTIQGTNWNNIQYHSLTSEYSDYIQFYKKNRDLSEERKDKIKLQLQRGRNNMREVFTLDYEAWIKSEAVGAVKMNKVAREILATYCPFGAEIRKNLMKQPLYEEAFARGCRERFKKVHELELRHKGLERNNISVPEELLETLRFYKEL